MTDDNILRALNHIREARGQIVLALNSIETDREGYALLFDAEDKLETIEKGIWERHVKAILAFPDES